MVENENASNNSSTQSDPEDHHRPGHFALDSTPSSARNGGGDADEKNYCRSPLLKLDADDDDDNLPDLPQADWYTSSQIFIPTVKPKKRKRLDSDSSESDCGEGSVEHRSAAENKEPLKKGDCQLKKAKTEAVSTTAVLKKERSDSLEDFPSFLRELNSPVSVSPNAGSKGEQDDDSAQSKEVKGNTDEFKKKLDFSDIFTTDSAELDKETIEDIMQVVHKAVTEAPSENQETPDPKGLKKDLLPHQRQDLCWLLNREKCCKWPGGILANDMGLGKTLSAISLIMKQKEGIQSRIGGKPPSRAEKMLNLTPSGATLVVCPATLIYQWRNEIQDKVHKIYLDKVVVFHGLQRNKKSIKSQLAIADMVITSYGTLSSEVIVGGRALEDDMDSDEEDRDSSDKIPKYRVKSSILTSIKWERLILDEAHCIKNPKSRRALACCELFAKARWCLTGTPIQNNLWDFFSLLKFLRFFPFADQKYWKDWVMPDKDGKMPRNRLDPLVKSVLKRRTKEELNRPDGSPLLQLKEKDSRIYEIDLIESERKIYDYIFEESRGEVAEILKQCLPGTDDVAADRARGLVTVDPSAVARRETETRGRGRILIPKKKNPESLIGAQLKKTMVNVFVYMLRLRQACCHYALLKDALDWKVLKDDAEMEEAVQKDEEAEKDMGNLIAKAALGMGKLFQKDWHSTKMRALKRGIDDLIGSCSGNSVDKCVIVSQWTSLLDIVQKHLEECGTKFTRIDGKVSLEERQERVEAFNKPNRAPVVMLLSLTAGGVGLNLTGGNHLFLLDLHWNPALEQQAFDRIYRIGQMKKVYVHKFVCKGTIEERVLNLQQNKLELAKNVLEGASKNLTRLTLNDIRYLFNLGPRD